MAKPRPLTENLSRVLAVIPEDGRALDQGAIYERLGEAQVIGSYLSALEKRGLIELVDGRWRRVRIEPHDTA